MADAFGSTYSPNSAAVKEAKRQSKIASNRELDRQARLDYGRALIESLFKGTPYKGLAAPKKKPKDKTVKVMGADVPVGTEMVSAYDPKKTYYDAKGKVWTPTPQGTATRTAYRTVPGDPSPGSGTGQPYYDSEGDLRYDSGVYARPVTQEAYQERYATGPSAADQYVKANLFLTQGGDFEGIGEDFYKGYIDSILDYQKPQLLDQFEKAQGQDAFSMARQGIFSSTAHNQRKADRTGENTDQLNSLINAAEGEGQKLRTNVDDARNTTLQLLESSEDPTRAFDQGLTEVNAVIHQQPTLSPLADLFSAGADAAASYQRTRQARQIADIYRAQNPNQSSGRTFG